MKKLLALLIAACCALHSTIFIAGQNDLAQATLWITDSAGTLIKTTPLDTSTSIAFNCIIAGSEVYICGTNSSGNPTLWITNLFGIPKPPISLSDQEGQAQAMIVSNHTIYVVGRSNSKASLWIIDKNTLNISTKILGLGFTANKITLYDNKLYITGADLTFSYRATLWITDVQGSLENTIYLSNIGTIPSGISSDGQHIYILSSITDIPSEFFLLQLNTNGELLNTIPFENVATFSNTKNIISKTGVNYMLTYEGLFVQPISKLTSTPYPLFIPNSNHDGWNFFDFNNLYYYIVGDNASSGAELLIYNLQGSLKRTTILDKPGSTGLGLAIQRSSFKKFSPLSFQKGF